MSVEVGVCSILITVILELPGGYQFRLIAGSLTPAAPVGSTASPPTEATPFAQMTALLSSACRSSSHDPIRAGALGGGADLLTPHTPLDGIGVGLAASPHPASTQAAHLCELVARVAPAVPRAPLPHSRRPPDERSGAPQKSALSAMGTW
jgi:hypothetical protein